MTPSQEISPGLTVRGFAPPRSLADFKLLVFGMDSAMLYPGAEELADACKAAGMAIEVAIGEVSDGAQKLTLLQSRCTSLGITPAQVLVLGSSASDEPLLRVAGLGACYRGTPSLAEHAMVNIQTGGFDRLLEVLTRHTTQTAPDLDLTVLDTLVGHDTVKFRKFATLFMQSVEAVMAEVDTAITQEDLAALAAMGHRAKSTALNIGASGFSRQCLHMEQAARAQDAATALAIARGLRPQFAAICAAIGRHLGD